MPETLYEKFSWIRDDLKFVGVRGNKAQFKGIALYPTVSGNGRKYVKEELVRAARTLVGKPLTLNHNMKKVKGNVTWAEEEEDRIEYVAESNDSEYVQKLKDRQAITKEAYIRKWGRDPIYGVSVEANYRYHDAACHNGRCVEPHGIIFNALSLVEDPARPGVAGTTIELLETQGHNELGLIEALVKDVVPKQFQSDIKLTPTKKIEEEMDEPECPEGHHMKDGKCVPDEDMEKDMETKQTLERLELDRKHMEERLTKELKKTTESITAIQKDLTGKISEVDKERLNCCNRLGETQKNLLDTDAIAKDTAGKVGKLDKWQSDSETILQANTQAIPKLTESMAGLSKSLEDKLGQTAQKTELAEVTKNITTLTETVTVTAKSLTDIQTKYATLNNMYEVLERKHGDYVKEINDKKLKETQDQNTKITDLENQNKDKDTKLKEMQDQIDTMKLHLKPGFKALEQDPKKMPKPADLKPPYTYGSS